MNSVNPVSGTLGAIVDGAGGGSFDRIPHRVATAETLESSAAWEREQDESSRSLAKRHIEQPLDESQRDPGDEVDLTPRLE
ncbi:MAG: hypothetical protein JRH16_07805 [Deltaproteobacteria bacterium]|nr:hypothetical protein [Deltaproteobacteria bacterium]